MCARPIAHEHSHVVNVESRAILCACRPCYLLFTHSGAGKYRAIWCLGLRNPFVFDFQAGTGRMLINDVGQSRLEEINAGVAGANYGWPHSEGPTANKEHRGPIHAYGRSVGRCICGGEFYPQKGGTFPAGYAGKYFFSDFMDHWIRVLDQEKPDELWIGHRNTPNEFIVKDPSLLNEKARGYADLPGGHSEGYDDTFKQVFRRFYRTVADRSAPVEYPTFEDGLRQLRILETVLESSKKHAWLDVS